MTKITTNIVSREELTEAIGNVTGAYIKDKEILDETLSSFKLNLNIIGDDRKEASTKFKAKTTNFDVEIIEVKLTHMLHQEKMADKITQLENEIQTLKNKPTKEGETQHGKQTPQKPKSDQDTRKNVIIEGLNEIPHEDVYQSVMQTIKQIGTCLKMILT